MEHKWRDAMMPADFVVTAGPDRPLTIAATIDGTTVEQPETLFAIPGYFVREFFRLAEENKQLREVRDLFAKGPDALEKAVVARIRRELRVAIMGLGSYPPRDRLLEHLDRICPEEK